MKWRAIVLTLFLICSAGAGIAHFKLNLNVRIFHLVQEEGALDLYFRTPMPYLVADKLGEVKPDALPDPAPFTFNRMEDGMLMHLVDTESLRNDPLGLGQIAADSLHIETSSGVLSASVISVRVHPVGSEPGFATRLEAISALDAGESFSIAGVDTYVGDAVVDVHLRYEGFPTGETYSLSSILNPGLAEQEETANLLLDYRGDTIQTYRARGLLLEPIILTGDTASAVYTFVIEGIRHILEGLDHVLFVLCMVLGALTLKSLVARVTGFTVGHTVTLILGFFGLAPKVSWFIPAVETLIAVSIIFVAVDAIIRRPNAGADDLRGVLPTALIGLLHGFGFSFMLQNILKVDAPNVWQSLLAFNVGVEIGQLLIVAAVWPLVVILRRMPGLVWRTVSTAVAGSAILISSIWVIERASAVFA